MVPAEYTFEAFPVLLEDGGLDPRVIEVAKAAHMSFHESDPGAVLSRRAARDAAARGARMWIARRSGQNPDRAMKDRPHGVLYYYPGSVNIGAGQLLDGGFLTYAAVRSTDTRRGLLRGLMERNLDAMVKEGLPVALLRASEGGIYGRFGFQPVYRCADLTISHPRDFQLGAPAAKMIARSGAIEEVTLPWLLPHMDAIAAEVHAKERLSINRQPGFSEALYFQRDRDELDPTVRAAVHFDPRGRVDGFLTCRVMNGRAGKSAQVLELLGTCAAAEIALWEFLAELDLISEVRAPEQPVDQPVCLALKDPRALRINNLSDYLWARVLDPVQVLESRAYTPAAHAAEMGLRFQVEDPMGYAAGVFELQVGRDGVSVAKGVDPLSNLVVTEGALAALAFGSDRAHDLAGAGLITGASADVLDYLDALFEPVGPARCTGDF